MTKKAEITQGNLIEHIFVYTIPLILSTIVQNLLPQQPLSGKTSAQKTQTV